MKYSIRRAIIFFAAGVMVYAAAVHAQAPAGDIPQNSPLAKIAAELGCTTKESCKTACDANLGRCIELSEAHKAYSPAEKQLAQSFKTEVLGKLSGVRPEEFEETIVKLAEGLLKSKPTLARQLDVKKQTVEAARTIVTEVKEAGTDLRVCSRPADTLAREQLVRCLEASKRLSARAETVRVYVPEERLAKADSAAGLETALARGEYRDLGASADEVGEKCLQPGSPAACDEIAKRFFGDKGAAMLAEARAQVGKTAEYYQRTVGNFVLVTPDGRTIAGKDAIRGACDAAFERRDIALAKSCGEFAVKNGLATQEEMAEGLKFLESVAAHPDVNFDQCRQNPRACEQFLPDAARGELGIMRQIEDVMRAEIGFEPSQCARGNIDQKIGQQCFEGSQRALPKLETIAAGSPEAKRIIEDIRRHVAEGERMTAQQQQVQGVFEAKGGPGGCRTAQECFAYCGDSAHSVECLSFGAQQGIFRATEVKERFQTYNERLGAPAYLYPAPAPGAFPQPQGQPAGGYPLSGQPGGHPGYSGPGPFPAPYVAGGMPPAVYDPRSFMGDWDGGVNPDCLAAIQSGDFAKAKELCRAATTLMRPAPPQACPQIFPVPCPQGQYRETRPVNGCPSYGECIAFPTPLPQPVPVSQTTATIPRSNIAPCPGIPTVASCPQGETRVVTYSSLECGTYYGCRAEGPVGPPQPPPPSGDANSCPGFAYSKWDSQGRRYCQLNAERRCDYNYPGYLANGVNYRAENCPAEAGGYPSGGGACDWATQYWKSAANRCEQKTNCTNPGYPDYASSECQGVRGTTGGISTGTWVSPAGQREQAWNSLGLRSWIRADADSTRIEGLKTACANVPSSSNVWMPEAGNAQNLDFGMPDPAKCASAAQCAAGTYFNGNSCTATAAGTGGAQYAGDANSCPGFAYSKWDSQGRRYCQLNAERRCDYNYPGYLANGVNYRAENCPATDAGYAGGGNVSSSVSAVSGCASAGGTWDSAANYCRMPGSGSCPSGQYWYVPPGSAAGYCQSGGVAATSTSGGGGGGAVDCSVHGTGAHTMDATGRCYSSDMTQYKESGASAASPWSSCAGAGQPVPYCTASAGGVPAAPSGLAAAIAANGKDVALTWNDGAANETGFKIWRRATNSGWSPLAQAASSSAGAVSYIDINVPTGVLDYQAQACNDAGCSPDSNIASVAVSRDTVAIVTSGGCSVLGSGWFASSTYCLNSTRTQYAPVSAPTPSSIQYCTGSNSPVSGCVSPSSGTGGGTGTTATSCVSGQYWNGSACVSSGYSSGGGTYGTPPAGQREQAWNSLGLRSWIRADADSARIESLKTACANVSTAASVWTAGAGDSASVDFGMPDPAKCASAASCASGTYFNGTSCVSSSGTSCPSGQYWNGSVCATATSGSASCPAGQYWYTPPSGGAGYCQTSGTGGGNTGGSSASCPDSLTALLGSGCHRMYTDTSGRAIYCDGPMSMSAREGDTATASGCNAPTSQGASPSLFANILGGLDDFIRKIFGGR